MRMVILNHIFQLVLVPTTLNNLRSQLLKYTIDILTILSTSFYKFHIMFLGEQLSLFFCYFPVFLHVSLGRHQNHVVLCVSHFFNLVHPVLNVCETMGISYRICKDYTMCTFVEGFSDVSESLLSCRVPDVQGDLIILELHPLYLEVHTNRTQKLCLKSIFTVTYQ